RRNELDDGTGSAEPLPDIVADPARAIATSGSTGTPKIIVSRNPGRGVPSQSLHNPSGRFMGHRAGQVQLIPAPLYHTNGFLILHNALFDGQSVLLMERFDAARMVDLIERYRVNTFVAVTIMLLRMARLPDIDRRDFSSVESLLHGGAMLPQWLARKWIDLVGPEHFFIAYGSSENAGSSMVRGDTWLEHPGTVGQPWQCDIKILDADGQELPPGEVGEIFMRWTGQTEPSFEYRGGQPRTREDLFSSIGDLGWLDDDGFLFLADRRDDLIISGGANIFAAEVEAALSDHPGVADVVVVGLADDEWGQRVHAVVQLSGEGATAEELRDHCRHRLASYKVPKSFAFVERLARTEAGKIRRSDYRSGTPTG
ncbi:MAG: feruloyl-CoA synthetase, partial [Acidimicrobiia bacterium]|nr:feruloyl-CoA synthetase [Acidimicrobiia bacterium]